MPVIRRLTNTQVAETPQRIARQTPIESGLGSLGEGTSNVARAVAYVQEQEREKADRASLIEAGRLLDETENALLLDPKNGALSRRGKNAFDLQGQVLPEYEKRAADIEKGLGSARQRTQFQEALIERRTRISRDLNRHEFDERERYYDDTDDAALTTSITSAANHARSPERISQEINRQREIVGGLAGRKGWDETVKTAKLREVETKTHESVVGRFLLDNNFRSAGRYLAENAPKMLDPTVEQLQRRIILEEEQAFAREEREQRRAAEGVIKTGDKLLSDGQLSASWIEANRSVLDPDDYRYFLRKLKGGDDESGPSDIIMYADLRERAGRGEDISAEARSAVVGGKIRSSDYDRLLSEKEGQRPSWYKRGSQFISTSAAVSDLNPDPAAAQRKAQMLDDWDEWARSNSKATDSEAQSEYRRLVDEYAIINTSKMSLTKRAPRFLVGSRNTPDLDATEDATVEAFQKGQIDEAEFNRQAALLEEWRRTVPPKPAAKKAP